MKRNIKDNGNQIATHPARPFYDTRELALGAAADSLNEASFRLNREACCNVYSTKRQDGRRFFVGKTYVGEHSNVVLHYLFTLPWERLRYCAAKFGNVRYEGFVHSHTRCAGHIAEKFSKADYWTAIVSGRTYLSSPSGNVYEITRRNAVKKDRERMVALAASGRYDEAMKHPKAQEPRRARRSRTV